MTQLQAEIIVALAENQLSVTEAAKKLFMHRTTLNYHIRKIRNDTGKNPLDFYDMCNLFLVAQRCFSGEVSITEQTRNALLAIGRQTHGDNDAP